MHPAKILEMLVRHVGTSVPKKRRPTHGGPAIGTIATLCVTIMLPGAIARADTASDGTNGWIQHTINDRAPFEGSGAGDFDGDGDVDIFSGDSWYEAPQWQRHKVRSVQPSSNPHYYEDFANIAFDVNADGHLDVVTCTYFGRRLGWVENPGGDAKKPWIEHDIDYPGPSEACTLVDINGDGRPDLLPATNNKIVWYELVGQSPKVVWERHEVSDVGAGHGLGYGDINGDGRLDILGPNGWYEQPTGNGGGAWIFHPEFRLGGASVPILGHDVDGDGLTDIIWGTAHAYGLQWLRQIKGKDGKRRWARRDIDPAMHQAHTILLIDLQGRGDPLLFTGTRVYGHEVEPGDVEAPEMAFYRFDRKKKNWDKTRIYLGPRAENPPADPGKRNAMKDFPRGTAGTGLLVTPVDIDGDGDLDLICPGKSGLYLFENPQIRPEKTAIPEKGGAQSKSSH